MYVSIEIFTCVSSSEIIGKMVQDGTRCQPVFRLDHDR
jgi:hypothetical protein